MFGANRRPRPLLRLREQLLRKRHVLLKAWAVASLLLRLLQGLLDRGLLLLLLLLLRVLLLRGRLVLVHGRGRGVPAVHARHLEGVRAPLHAWRGAFWMHQALRKARHFLHGAQPSSLCKSFGRSITCILNNIWSACISVLVNLGQRRGCEL